MSIVRTKTGFIHRIDDHGYGPRPRHHERRSPATIGNYEKFVEILAEFGPLDGDELQLIFDRRKHAIYTAARFLERKGVIRRVGWRRERPGKPVPVFDFVRTRTYATESGRPPRRGEQLVLWPGVAL